jgi:hypothetical protein
MRLALLLLCAAAAWGQCAMCFRNAEAQSRAHAHALNKGIAVLLVPVAASAGLILRLAYKRRARTI